MNIHVIVDSCCDLPEYIKKTYHPDSVPLTVRVTGSKDYRDDGSVDIAELIADMTHSKQGATSACPSPDDFASHVKNYDECFILTLSSKLSGSYNTACVAAQLIQEEYPEKKVHVFDSKTASAGEVHIALFLFEKIDEGLSFEEIIPLVEEFISRQQTLFVLEDLGNFIKNGRIGKASGILASVLSLCPVMGDDGNGEIRLVAKVRGIRNALHKLVDIVAEQTADKASRSLRLVLAHCNCPVRAGELRLELMEKCQALRDVIIVPTGALSSMYANNGGIIVAYA